MDFLDGRRAHAAVSRALGDQFIIPDAGERMAPNAIEFRVMRRGATYGDFLAYRVRLSDDGVLLGHFVGQEVRR